MTLVEVLGVAGAGKSTLTERLIDCDPNLVRGEFIHSRRLSHLGHIVHGLPDFGRPYLSATSRKPRPSWADFKLMAYLTEWDRYLSRRSEYENKVVVLDQGPLYALVRLRAKELSPDGSTAFNRWWHDRLAAWTGLLNAVVWLDAGDEILMRRIDSRSQTHVVKGEHEMEARAFLNRYRDLFTRVMSEVEEHDVEVLRYDTSRASASAIADDVITRLGGIV